MQRPDPSMQPGEDYRQLRAISILMLPLGFSLMIPYAVITEQPFPAAGIAPMFFSAALGSLIYTNLLRSPSKRAIIDVSLTVVYFSLLVPSWLTVLYHDWNGVGLAMLGTYGTATMMVNFTIHLFVSICSARFISLPTITWQSDVCPDCEHHHNRRSFSRTGHQTGLNRPWTGHALDHGLKEARQPFISPDDNGSRESSEYQTSGFNSPRQSAETLATDLHTDLGDIAGRLA